MASKETLKKLSDMYYEESARHYLENLLYFNEREKLIRESVKRNK